VTVRAQHYSSAALKRSAMHFLTGKVVSALLNLLLLLWLVRLLPVGEYGVYVTLVAGMELAFGLSGFGISWMAARYLPEYRLHAHGARLLQLVWRMIAWASLSLFSFALIIYVSMGRLLATLDLGPYRHAAVLYLLILFFEGLGKHARETLLGPLLQQGSAQTSQIVRNFVFLSALALVAVSAKATLLDVIHAEIAASILGSAVGLLALGLYLRKHKNSEGQSNWKEPKTSEMWNTSLKMYLSETLTMLYSPQIFTMLVQHQLGLEATAVFGFLRSLYEQIARYLPATLLFSLVRPKLVASYVSSGNMQELSGNANLAGKLSLFILMPLVAFSGVAGEDVIRFLSGARFPNTGMYFFGFMLALVPFSQRQIIESVAVASGESWLCTRAAFSGLLMLPLMYMLILGGLGLWAAIISLGLGHFVFNTIIFIGMSRGMGYSADFTGFQKLAVCAFAGYLSAFFLVTAVTPLLTELIGQAITILAVFLIAAYIAKPFTADERAKINSLLNRRLFVW
jgi:O-antigen/teichoic acid export membrane protein